jgi:glucose-1-phosphate thymidylyltransferase
MSPEVMITTQQRMFGRRSIEQRPCDIQLIHDMFRLTAKERPVGLRDEPPQF